MQHRASSLRSGFSLPEAMIAVVVTTIACTAMLLSVCQAIQASHGGTDTNRANLLLQDLMNEISACHWADPISPSHWGPEADELITKTRVAFDDIDDYDGWNGPPQTRDGITYDLLQKTLFPSVTTSTYAQYTQSVHVEYVNSAGDVMPAGTTSSYRRVTILISQEGRPPHKLNQIFQDAATLLGRTNWFDPTVVEPIAKVLYVP